MFLIHGLVFATWICRIPAMKNQLDLSHGVLGLVLLSTAAGSILTMPLMGWLIAHHGSRQLAIGSSFAFCLALLPLPWVRSPVELAVALLLYGAAAGAQNVSMNAHAVIVEEEIGYPIMSSFHALFSVGAMIGAAAGGWLAGIGVSLTAHFTGSSVLFLTIVALLSPGLHRPDRPAAATSLSLRFSRTIGALGLLAFCVLMVEGAIADWSAVYLESVLGFDGGREAFAYAIYSATMVAGRFAGDWAAAVWGRELLVRYGAMLASAGLFLSLLVSAYFAVLASYALVGLGISVITPNVYGAAGSVQTNGRGVGLAAVTTAGYLGLLTGPPLIGFLAQLTNLRTALGAAVVSLAIGALLAGSIRVSEQTT